MNRRKILCPECKGEKECMYVVGVFTDDMENLPCITCGGEGIVIEETVINYKKLKYAK